MEGWDPTTWLRMILMQKWERRFLVSSAEWRWIYTVFILESVTPQKSVHFHLAST
jgi:hypothetical protein